VRAPGPQNLENPLSELSLPFPTSEGEHYAETELQQIQVFVWMSRFFFIAVYLLEGKSATCILFK